MSEIDSAVNTIEDRIGYSFRNKGLIREALTHSSFANERKMAEIELSKTLVGKVSKE